MKCNDEVCICFKCKEQKECSEFEDVHSKGLHRWVCTRTGRNLIAESFQRTAEEMRMLERVL